MNIEGALNHFTITAEELAASTFRAGKIVIADNIVSGNALLIKKIDYQFQEAPDIGAAGSATEKLIAGLSKQAKASAVGYEDEDVFAVSERHVFGNATDNTEYHLGADGDSKKFGFDRLEGLLFPYKFMHYFVLSTNAAALGFVNIVVWYYPVTLSQSEKTELIEEAFINQ